MSTVQAATSSTQPAGRPAEPDHVREVFGFALLCARTPDSRKREMPAVIPRVVSEVDVRAVPVAELRALFDAVLLSRKADLGLHVLWRSGVLGLVLPEVTAMIGFGEGTNRHKDVWLHTLQVVVQSVPRTAVRWAALFHDVGKPRTRSIADDGTVHFLHHAEVGARMFERIARRERLFPDEAEHEAIRFLIYNHQRAHQYDANWTDSAARRFGKEIGCHLEDLLALSRADMTTKRKDKRRRFMEQLKVMQSRIETLRELDAKPKALPKGLGEAIIAEFKLPPSKLVGTIRKALEDAVERQELPLQADFRVYLDFVRQNAGAWGLDLTSKP
jgi:poly(A) polymerase